MRLWIAAITLALAANGALAQEKKDKQPSEAQKKQQERMKQCNERAADKKGDERQKFMSACLKGGGSAAQPTKAQKAQQDRMKACNKQASDKKLKGEDRQKFMSGCLKT
jgi:hypothetical protein